MDKKEIIFSVDFSKSDKEISYLKGRQDYYILTYFSLPMYNCKFQGQSCLCAGMEIEDYLLQIFVMTFSPNNLFRIWTNNPEVPP